MDFENIKKELTPILGYYSSSKNISELEEEIDRIKNIGNSSSWGMFGHSSWNTEMERRRDDVINGLKNSKYAYLLPNN